MLAIAGLLAAGPAAAETSSWSSTVERPDAPVPKKAPGPAKLQKGEPPKTVPGGDHAASATGGTVAVPKTPGALVRMRPTRPLIRANT
jgi:hypothetical protein